MLVIYVAFQCMVLHMQLFKFVKMLCADITAFTLNIIPV